MNLQEKLKGMLGKDIFIKLIGTDDRGYNYNVKGTLKEVGEDYFVIDELQEDKAKNIEEKIFTFNSVLNFSLYRFG